MPFVIAGIWYLCRRHRLQRPAYRVIPITLATYPVAALTIDPYHSTRCINGAIVWTLLIAMGAIAMWRRGRWMKAAVLALIIGTTIETGLYMKDYWTEFRRRVTLWNDDALTQTLKEGISRLRPGEAIYISASCFFHKIRADFKPYAYAHILFFGRVDPARYQAHGLPDYIRPYFGSTTESGLLLRCDS